MIRNSRRDGSEHLTQNSNPEFTPEAMFFAKRIFEAAEKQHRKNKCGRPGGGRIRGEGGDTPTRQSYALCPAVRLLSGLADRADKTSAARVSASSIKLAPSEIHFRRDAAQSRALDEQHCPTGIQRPLVVKRDSLFVKILHLDHTDSVRLPLLVERYQTCANRSIRPSRPIPEVCKFRRGHPAGPFYSSKEFRHRLGEQVLAAHRTGQPSRPKGSYLTHRLENQRSNVQKQKDRRKRFRFSSALNERSLQANGMN